MVTLPRRRAFGVLTALLGAVAAAAAPAVGQETTTTTTPTVTETQSFTVTIPAPKPAAQATPGGPTLIVKKPRVAWNRVSIGYRLIKGSTILLEVIGPDGSAHVADLRSGATRGSVVWNRRIRGRVVPPGRYRLQLTAGGTRGGITRKTISVRLGLLYAHAPGVKRNGVTIRYELTEPAAVTLTATSAQGASTVVSRRTGHRGANHITWDLHVRGHRASGRYRLAITARTVAGATARVIVPAPNGRR